VARRAAGRHCEANVPLVIDAGRSSEEVFAEGRTAQSTGTLWQKATGWTGWAGQRASSWFESMPTRRHHTTSSSAVSNPMHRVPGETDL
jgi:hypothetical protein